MADLNAVNKFVASAPQSFLQKDRTEELKDARQAVSQFDNRSLAQNVTVNTDQRADSSTTVFAANSVSDSNTARRTATAASSLEVSSDSGRLQQTVDAFAEQLQRASLERQSRPRDSVEPRDPAQSIATPAREVESRSSSETTNADQQSVPVRQEAASSLPEPADNSAPAGTRAESSGASETPDSSRQPAPTAPAPQESTLASAPERESAEDALGLS